MSVLPSIGIPLERHGADHDEFDATARALPGDQPPHRPAAVIVCHGMGQQVEFETLSLVADAVWRRQSAEPLADAPVRVRYVAFDDQWHPRVEMTLGTPDGRTREVHFYEAYWAPLTEGRVRLGRVLAFLASALVRGVRYVVRGSFDRWMFGARQPFALPRRTLLPLVTAGAVFVAVMASGVLFAVFALRQLLALGGIGALDVRDAPPVTLAALAAGLMTFAALRWCLVQSVGDVCAYISAHEASQFADIRRRIRAMARMLARNVYGSRVPGRSAHEYADVVIVGHSLGSVIAYDMLNDVINRDLLLASIPGGAAPMNVVERTALLLTIGSPLDKTAFLFRTQKDDAPVRETLAAAVQPMIVSYANRPRRWINIWSRRDWVSGPLDFYDARPVPPLFAARAVENLREPRAPLDPVRAHTGYWMRPTLGAVLYDALTAIAVTKD
ncbi:MAG: hypothetical protein ACREOJ_16750 [Gemmatimonadaceae bacterium]